MKFTIVAVGRPRDHALAAAIEEYEQRARRYWPLDVAEVREETGRDAASTVDREGERLLAKAAGATIVVCAAEGKTYTSEAFAGYVQRLREAARDVAFVIGGAFGLARDVRSAAASELALAPWTLPHELARLVLAEQLYRAGTIVRREPYHK